MGCLNSRMLYEGESVKKLAIGVKGCEAKLEIIWCKGDQILFVTERKCLGYPTLIQDLEGWVRRMS